MDSDEIDEAQGDGWDLEDDDLNVDDFETWNDHAEEEDSNMNLQANDPFDASPETNLNDVVGDASLPIPTHYRVDQNHNESTQNTDENADNGWNDDNFLDLSETSRIENTSSSSRLSKQAVTDGVGGAVASGWDDDLDLDDDVWTTKATSTVPPDPIPPPAVAVVARLQTNNNDTPPVKNNTGNETPTRTNATRPLVRRQLHHAVQDYLIMLPKLTPSITAVLQAEYNTPSKALELQHYYADRPALATYTMEKELPRMDYILTDARSGDIIDDKILIAKHFDHASSQSTSMKGTRQHSTSASALCVRCANQSLLADMLQVLTGHDRVIRTQFHATAVATQCRFRVDLVLGLVEVNATLTVSLPTEQGRWKVAELRVMILFQCGSVGGSGGVESTPPTVEFRLVDIRPTVTVDNSDAFIHCLDQCIQVLDTLAAMDDNSDKDDTNDAPPQSSPVATLPPNVRDAFLQSQNRLSASATNAMMGMQSAWHDLDAVTGWHSKWKQLPTLSLLPDASVWHDAALDEQNEQERQLQYAAAAATSDVVVTSRRIMNEGPRPHEPQRPPIPLVPPQPPQQQRPTSILGGLVRSLAKTVALPEEDASLYQDWQTASESLAIRDGVASAVLHGGIAPTAPPPSHIPRLYNPDTPPTRLKPTVPAAGTIYAPLDEMSTVRKHSSVGVETALPSVAAAPTVSPIPRLYNTKPSAIAPPEAAARPAAPTTAQPSSLIPKLYNTETPPTVRKATVTAVAVAPNLMNHGQTDHRSSIVEANGWSDDDDDIVKMDDLGVLAPPVVASPIPTLVDAVDLDSSSWHYDPVTDIIPTRTRWVHSTRMC